MRAAKAGLDTGKGPGNTGLPLPLAQASPLVKAACGTSGVWANVFINY